MGAVQVVGDGVVGRRVMTMVSRDASASEGPASAASGCRVAVLASGGPHAVLARQFLIGGTGVVTVGDEIEDCLHLLDLADVAESAGVPLVVGAAMSPGLSGLLVRSILSTLDTCSEIHVALHGTAGPACARGYHDSLSGWSSVWWDGRMRSAPAGSGRELLWFPEPIGPKDCYLASIASPVLLHRSLPDVNRVSVRRSARRRDRFTARLPMLREPHAEGGPGALRVELRGIDRDGRRATIVRGVADQVGTATAAVASVFAEAAARGELPAGLTLASDPISQQLGLLQRVVAKGIRVQEYTGTPALDQSARGQRILDPS